MKYVYNLKEGNKDMLNILGGKGANLAEMSRLNLSVPSGFIISTVACNNYLENQNVLANTVIEQVDQEVKVLENLTEKSFGSHGKTLLFSVRSGAPVSMPGMMDTILNLGLNDETVQNFAKETNNEEMAYDCYRRLIQMYGNVVYGISNDEFEHALSEQITKSNVQFENELSAQALQELITEYKVIFLKNTKEEFPQDVKSQLKKAIEAVFSSWNNERAKTYRKLNNIPSDLGTAVVVQEMVFGNYNNQSSTGVLFSRNPNTAEPGIYGEYLVNAQGEDVVAGIRTPLNINNLKTTEPKVYEQLKTAALYLEEYYKDMQDIEFTVENGKLFILQTRSAKRSNKAKINYLLEMLEANVITQEEFVNRIDKEDIEAYLFSQFSDEELHKYEVFATGLPASEGATTGKICFTEEDVMKLVEQGEKAILVRNETSPEDINSMHHSEAIVTAFGGMTSHAAVVARGMGTCCVCGVTGLKVNPELRTVTFGERSLNLGDVISVSGTTGKIYIGAVPLTEPELDKQFFAMMKVIDAVKKIKVYANADEGNTGKEAVKYGAEGVGLVRTEHMFFDEERLLDMQALIMSSNDVKRLEFLKRMEQYQRADFIELFEVLAGKSISVRLLDPPLHEFLPHKPEQAEILAKKLSISTESVLSKISELTEENPMLGHRGCRLAVSYPAICQMQVRAIVGAILELEKQGITSEIKLIIPLIAEENELLYLKTIIEETINELTVDKNNINIALGVMIETPRAALISDKLSANVDFFSYGTNDLTQLTYGFSRDDVAKFLPTYFEKEIISKDPFVTLDSEVGKLVVLSNDLGKANNSELVTGICGEHGGDFDSVIYACENGLDYVSCSPKRIPVAKLAAAKAVLKGK